MSVMSEKTLVLTNCTGRKRVGGDAITLAPAQMNGTLPTVANAWTRALASAPRSRRADDIYAGRSFAEARRVANGLGATLHIVSAGLGVVAASEMVPRYDLTVADGPNSIRPLLVKLGMRPSDWWNSMLVENGERRSVHRLVKQHPNTLLLIALPASYLEMVVRDIDRLSDDDIARLRIFSSARGQSVVSERVRQVVLPYDDRLEGSAFPGTRNDFAQRALRHFTEELFGHRLPLPRAHEAVARAMLKMRAPQVPLREKKNDAEIAELLRENWVRFDGASSRLLRFLRDDVLVACEQKRFRTLWTQVRLDINAGT